MNPHISGSPLGNYKSAWGPLIVIANGGAMHSVSNFDVPRRKMEGLLKDARKTNGTLIPMTLHYPGVNKVEKYRTSQGPPQIEAINKKIVQWAYDHNLWPLRLYEYTQGLWSPDGVHYLDENIVFAQLLLNSLWRMQHEHNVLSLVPENNPEDPTTYKFPYDMESGPLGPEGHIGNVPRPYESLP